MLIDLWNSGDSVAQFGEGKHLLVEALGFVFVLFLENKFIIIRSTWLIKKEIQREFSFKDSSPCKSVLWAIKCTISWFAHENLKVSPPLKTKTKKPQQWQRPCKVGHLQGKGKLGCLTTLPSYSLFAGYASKKGQGLQQNVAVWILPVQDFKQPASHAFFPNIPFHSFSLPVSQLPGPTVHTQSSVGSLSPISTI